VARWFEEVDLLALPTTVSTAARVSDAEMARGLVDTRLLDGLCRFAFLANLTGLPAGSSPVGVDGDGLPIGFQLIVMPGRGHRWRRWCILRDGAAHAPSRRGRSR
jgi:aspartyl-tRNA(Asn)/glutamyl-tRNA(Gln) amidotransferase subunit A